MKRTASILFVFFCLSLQGLSQNEVLKIGHRGCAGLMPENTIAGMLKAIDLGVTVLELDVFITKDQKVVVSHDPFFSAKYTTKPNGVPLEVWEEGDHILYKLDYDSVKKYDVGLKYNPQLPSQKKMKAIKPLLTDLIDSVESYCIQKRLPAVNYLIEIKDLFIPELHHPPTNKFVDLVISSVSGKKINSRVIIGSFSVPAMRYVHDKFPGLKTCLYSGVIENFQEVINALGFYPTYYSPSYSLVTDLLVASCNYNSVKVIPWTVNYKNQIDSLINMGVDGVVSDYPNHIDVSTAPVEFGYRRSACNNNVMEFSWQTASETNVDFFQIERSLRGVQWEKVASVPAKGGGLNATTYTWREDRATSKYPFYRIAVFPKRGSSRYFSFRSTSNCFDKKFNLALFPNPASIVLKGRIVSELNESVKFYIYNLRGQLVKKSDIELVAGINNFNVANINGWAKGEYKVLVDKAGSEVKTYTVFKL